MPWWQGASASLAVPCSRVDDNGALALLVSPCLCNGDCNNTWEGSGNGISTPFIAFCLRNDDEDNGGGADDGALASLVVPRLCSNDCSSSVQEGSNNSALALLIFPLTTAAAAAALTMAPWHYQSSLACETTAAASALTTAPGHC